MNNRHFADTKRLTHAGGRALVEAAVAEAELASVAIACAVTDAGGHLIA